MLKRPSGTRLKLRQMAERDADELYALIDADREHLIPWMPWAASQTREGTLAFIRHAVRQEQIGEGCQRALVVGGRIAGVAGFHRIDRDNESTSIGYWLAAEYEGRGLMTEAVRRLVGDAFGTWGLHRIEIRAAPANTRSRAICERLGFTEEGLLRDAERFDDEFRDLILYSLLADEWR